MKGQGGNALLEGVIASQEIGLWGALTGSWYKPPRIPRNIEKAEKYLIGIEVDEKPNI
jgi:hypothetical protein